MLNLNLWFIVPKNVPNHFFPHPLDQSSSFDQFEFWPLRRSHPARVMPFYLGALRRVPADRFFFWGGGKSWRRGPNLLPLSSFSTDLGHFISKLLNFDIDFFILCYILSLFSRFFGGGKQTTLGLWGWGHGPVPPWIRLWHYVFKCCNGIE